MKRTNSHFFSFWLKVFPVVLMLLSIGLTKTQAQNYKPLDEAVASVVQGIEDLKAQGGVKISVPKGSGQSTTGALSPSQSSNAQLVTFEFSYFEAFLEKAKQTGDVAQAVQALDAAINAQGQPQSRVTTYNAGRADLLDLITY